MIEIKNIIKGISNLIHWFPVIWRDRDWDYHFIYVLLHKKLQRMESFYLSNKPMSANAQNTAKEISKVKEALNRIINDINFNEQMKRYEEKYGDNDLFTFEKIEGKDYSRLKICDTEEQIKLFRECCDDVEKLNKSDKAFVFDYMRDNIEKWWD